MASIATALKTTQEVFRRAVGSEGFDRENGEEILPELVIREFTETELATISSAHEVSDEEL